MRNSSPRKSNKKSFSHWLHNYSVLLLGVTCSSIVFSVILSWNNQCSSEIYSSQSIDSTSQVKIFSELNNQYHRLIWFYSAIILGFSTSPWLLAHFLKQRAISSAKKTRKTVSKLPNQSTPTLSQPTFFKEDWNNLLITAKQPVSYQIDPRQAKKIKLPFE